MAAPNTSSSKPPAAAALAGPGPDTSDVTSLSGSGLYGDAAAGGMGDVQGMLCADARGLCVQGALYVWLRVWNSNPCVLFLHRGKLGDRPLAMRRAYACGPSIAT